MKKYLYPRDDNPWADHIRSRLRNRVALERGITMRAAAHTKLLECLDEAATADRIAELHAEAIQETLDATWGFEIEARLREFHGDWRYDGQRDVLFRDMAAAGRFYVIAFTMDSMLQACKFHMVRTREERLDDAAWFPISKERST